MPAIVAAELARVRNLGCTCRQHWERTLRAGLVLGLAQFKTVKARVRDYTTAKYMQIVSKLTLDLRIFLGSNVLVFAILLALTFRKPQAATHMLLPGTLLVVATLVCGYAYLFLQNWFFTILFDDYTGFAFLVHVLLVFGVLCDIAMNKARVTTRIVNGIGQVFEWIPVVSPC